MGQLEAMSSTALEQLWAISKSLAVSGYGPTPCHRQCWFRVFLGHQEAIGSTYFERSLANSMRSASPTSLERWANSKLWAALLRSNCGPSAGHRQYLVMGQPHAIGSAGLECFWAIRKPSAARILRGAWPIRCHRHHLPLWRDGPTQCHRQCWFRVFLGHQEAIGSTYFEGSLGNLMPSASPTSLERWANPMPSAVLV
jgi:hypothetical protein